MINKRIVILLSLVLFSSTAYAQEPDKDQTQYTIFDDRMLLDGYTNKFANEDLETILSLIKDETISSYKHAGAVKVLRQKHVPNLVSREKRIVEKHLWRRLNRTNSAFVQIEIMHALVKLDRYKYFKNMVPQLIQKMDHYNTTVNELSFKALSDITSEGTGRAREARIVFNTLRKMLFLSRKRLAEIQQPDDKLQMKINILRWSIKVLGTQELKKLPTESLHLL